MFGLECRVKEFLEKHKDIKKIDNNFTVKRSIYKVNLPNEITEDLFRFIGILHGDGNMSFKRIHISDKSENYHEFVIRPLFQRIFGIKLNIFNDKNRNTYYSYIKNTVIYRFLTEVLEVPNGAVRANLFVPIFIKETTTKLKAAHVAGLFDSEGHISKRQAEINFSTTSEELFNFVKDFLDKINVKFSIYLRDRRKNREYELYIYGKNNIRTFTDSVKINHPDKLSRLYEIFPVH